MPMKYFIGTWKEMVVDSEPSWHEEALVELETCDYEIIKSAFNESFKTFCM